MRKNIANVVQITHTTAFECKDPQNDNDPMSGTFDSPDLDSAYGWDNNVMRQVFENGSKYSISRPKWIFFNSSSR